MIYLQTPDLFSSAYNWNSLFFFHIAFSNYILFFSHYILIASVFTFTPLLHCDGEVLLVSLHRDFVTMSFSTQHTPNRTDWVMWRSLSGSTLSETRTINPLSLHINSEWLLESCWRHDDYLKILMLYIFTTMLFTRLHLWILTQVGRVYSRHS